MAYFTVRVEFHGRYSETDCERLHHEMAKEGFVRLIVACGDETTYRLPAPKHNLFDEDDDDATMRVLETARRAAGNTGKKFSVLVTKNDGGKRELYDVLKWKKVSE